MLESYVAGSWRTPTDDGAPLLDAATGEEVARISTAPVPAADAVRYARQVGGPALRSMTFHERAMLVKELALALKAHTDELYELSYSTGCTAKDTAIDVDGGIVTMLGMSSTARRTLPNDVVATDGPVERLSRGGTFLAQHVWTPLRGVAVQVNAYNFPVWGALEKLAPALIAGVPSIVKPAEQTAYVTERMVRLAIGTGILPEGALQLLVGAPGGAAGRARRSGPALLHRVRRHRGRAARAPGRRAPGCPLHGRGGLAERRRARARRGRGHPGARPLRP